ncbi:MAG: selenocysteine-specific translation elongation factor [candidate division WOR-3 bacterium]
MARHIVVGTAGHIDHGKSALIKSLTGYDPDRLKEEKERGMTTDLGFAFYGDDVTIIDVPGHEKFVRHMLAGASTIDFVIFVVAADDGVMPQTVEHFEILKLLDVKKGVIVVTKKDLVNKEQLELVIDDINQLTKDSFLKDAPIVAVSNLTGEGMDELKRILNELISQLEPKMDKGIFRMPIDRCFTMKGFGTVIAGTILSGKVKVGDTVELLPQKKHLKVRRIEVHNKEVIEVGTGYRAAVNIIGVEKEEIERGNVIATPGYLEPSLYMNANLYLLSSSPPLKTFTRLRIHLGTAEILGRVVILEKKILEPGEKGMVQFRLETPAVSDIGDRYVVRTYSPQITIGGGVILEPKAKKIKEFDEQLLEHLKKIETQDPIVLVEEDLNSNFTLPQKIEEIARDVNLPPETVQTLIGELVTKNLALIVDERRNLYYSKRNLDRLEAKIIEAINIYHQNNPTHIGIAKTELISAIDRQMDHILFNFALNRLLNEKKIKISEDGKVSRYDFKFVVSGELKEMKDRLEKIFYSAGFMPPTLEELLEKNIGSADLVKKAYRHLIDTGILIHIGEGIFFHKDRFSEAREKLIQYLKTHNSIRVSEFRDLINTTRKYALPLLIYFDSKGITIKRGEVRILAGGGGV